MDHGDNEDDNGHFDTHVDDPLVVDTHTWSNQYQYHIMMMVIKQYIDVDWVACSHKLSIYSNLF